MHLSPERLVRQLSGHRLPQTGQQLPRHLTNPISSDHQHSDERISEVCTMIVHLSILPSAQSHTQPNVCGRSPCNARPTSKSSATYRRRQLSRTNHCRQWWTSSCRWPWKYIFPGTGWVTFPESFSSSRYLKIICRCPALKRCRRYRAAENSARLGH